MAKIYERSLSTIMAQGKFRDSFDPRSQTLSSEESTWKGDRLEIPCVVDCFFYYYTFDLLWLFHIRFKVDRPQTTVVAKNLSVLQLFISRMPKMCAILQLVSAPLNPIPIAEHFRRSHPQCEHSCEQHIYMSKENNAKQKKTLFNELNTHVK